MNRRRLLKGLGGLAAGWRGISSGLLEAKPRRGGGSGIESDPAASDLYEARVTNSKDVQVWVEDPYAWVTKDARTALGPEMVLATEQGINEREHTSFVVRASVPLQDVRIRVSPLSGSNGTIREKDIRVREVKWLAPAEGQGEMWKYSYDAWTTKKPMPELLEDVLGPIQLEKDEARHIWLTVDSHKAKAGRYEGTVRLTSRNGMIASIPIRVTVWDIKLPVQPAINVDQWESIPGPARLAEKFGELEAEHYVNIHLINYPDAKDGQLDWTHWAWKDRAQVMGRYGDKVVIDLRRRPDIFGGPAEGRIDKYVEEEVGVPFEQILKDMVAKLNECGVPTANIYIASYDKLSGTLTNGVALETFRRIKNAVPDIRTVVTVITRSTLTTWLQDPKENAVFKELETLVDLWLFKEGFARPTLFVQSYIERSRQLIKDYQRLALSTGPARVGEDMKKMIDAVQGALDGDPEAIRVSEWMRSQQKSGKELGFYWNAWRSCMSNHQLDGFCFSFWNTWYFDVDECQQGCTTGIWTADWRYWEFPTDALSAKALDGRLKEYEELGSDAPVFTSQPPEHQMLFLIKYVRCLPGGGFRMVSTKRNEAFADGVRDYIYLGSLEQVARRALASNKDELKEAGAEALLILSEQYRVVSENSNAHYTYQTAKRALVESIMKLQGYGLEVQSDQDGRLIRHRRYGLYHTNLTSYVEY